MEDTFDILNFTADLDISALCCDEEFNGFDKQNGNNWIYPTNYPVRDYQYNIIKAGLFKNTLVSLPTGLGKTFIAAVIMYNFYRWYPMGKIIFVAPTRPLVAQQIDACYNIMAIPRDDTIEMTGTMSITNRKAAWIKKRVIFATPQVVQNDLESGNCPSELVRCLVIDEAHKAKGRYSFCQIVESLTLKNHNLFRVLALSATPGSKVDDVIQVVKNLKISHLELRSEECIDVSAYSFSRKIQTVVIPLGEDLSYIRNNFLEIIDKYTRRLVQFKVLTSNIGTLSKGRIIMLFKEYQTRAKSQRHPQHGHIMLDFTMVITLYHALELLTRHGARVFLNFFDDHPDKTWVGKDDRLVSLLERLRDDLGVNPMSLDLSSFPDGTVPEIKDKISYGHPKFDHLKREISEHFNNAKYRGQKTKAIVFCEYRESVNLVHCLLLQCRPLVKPQIFIGQGPGSGTGKDAKVFSQKQQLKVMQMFRDDVCNVLVSTCVGEEGLDIGNVDLIICFDISNKSPVRLVQRCGRTGRERSGRVVILVTEGREHQTLQDCIYERDNLNKKILQSKQLQEALFKNSPRMVPLHLKPECLKMYITVAKKVEETSKSKKVQSNLKNLLTKSRKSFDSDSESAFISKDEYMSSHSNNVLTNFITESSEIWNKTKDFVKNSVDFGSDKSRLLSKWTEYQRSLQYTSKIGHSIDSEIYTKLLQFADSKRFNNNAVSILNSDSTVPVTQTNPRRIAETMPKKSSVIKKQAKPPKGINDIRKMFRNVAKANNDEEAIFSCKLEEFLNKFGVNTSTTQSISEYLKSEKIPSHLLDLIVELELDRSQRKKDVNSNTLEINVGKMDTTLPAAVLTDFSFPEISCFKGFGSITWDCLNTSTNCNDINVIDAFAELEEFCPCPDVIENEFNHYDCETQNCVSPDVCDDKNKTIAYNDNCKTTNFDLIDMDAIFGDSFSSQGNGNKLKSEDDCLKEDPDIGNETKIACAQNETKKGLDFFGLDDIDTIFGNSESNEVDSKEKTNENLALDCSIDKNKDCSKTSENNGTKSGLEFFGLDNIEDLYFGDSSDASRNDLDMNITEIPISDNDDDSNQSIENVVSPIISSQIPKKSIFHKTADSVKSFQKSFKESSQKDDGSTFFSISQAINFISSDNKSTGGSLKKVIEFEQTPFSNSVGKVHHEESNGSDGSQSVILCTQGSKWEFNRRKISPKQYKPNIVIPASSDESDTTDEVNYGKTDNEKIDSNQNINKINSDVFKSNISTLEKRELSSEDEISPFFHKFPKIENVSMKNTSLMRKNTNVPNISKLKNLTLSNMKENVRPDDENVSCLNISSDHDLSTNFEKDKSLGVSEKPTLNLSKFECSTNRSFNHLNGDKNDNCDSDDDFVEKSRRSFRSKNDKSLEENKKKRVKKKKKACEFIDYEAILSDDSYEGGSSEENSGSDTTLGSFICDENDDADVSIDIQSKYLQSIKSPVNVGKFKIPKIPDDVVDVFSQECPVQDTSYELDSFCVGNENGLTQANEWTELEIAESLLKKRKRKKQKRTVRDLLDSQESEVTSRPTNKYKRVRLRISSDDSE